MYSNVRSKYNHAAPTGHVNSVMRSCKYPIKIIQRNVPDDVYCLMKVRHVSKGSVSTAESPTKERAA